MGTMRANEVLPVWGAMSVYAPICPCGHPNLLLFWGHPRSISNYIVGHPGVLPTGQGNGPPICSNYVRSCQMLERIYRRIAQPCRAAAYAMPFTGEQGAGSMEDVAVKDIKDPVTTVCYPQAPKCGHEQLSANGCGIRI